MIEFLVSITKNTMVTYNSLPKDPKFAVIYSKQKKCITTFNYFNDNLQLYDVEEADIILCLGGDGFMLHTLHNCIDLHKPIYGINCGNLGFLLNDINIEDTIEQFINELQHNLIVIRIHPLEITYVTDSGDEFKHLAFNEASLLRRDGIASHLKIFIDGSLKCNKLVSDGALVSTPLGSLAYNKACGGPIIPLNSKLLILTSINTFEPSHFKGAILPDSSEITFEVSNSSARPVNLFCDFIKHEYITHVTIKKSKTHAAQILFNKTNHLEEKVSNAQFSR